MIGPTKHEGISSSDIEKIESLVKLGLNSKDELVRKWAKQSVRVLRVPNLFDYDKWYYDHKLLDE